MIYDIRTSPLHLGLGATAVPQPEHTGDMAWYAGYGARHGGDGVEGRLVAMHRFTTSWTTWERHPHGSEVVLCLEGRLTLVQEVDGEERRITLEPHQYAINEPGVWHTADVDGPVAALFLTAGLGTEHRPRG